MAVEQPLPKLLFEGLNMAAHGGLAAPQLRGRRREGTGFGHGKKALDQGPVGECRFVHSVLNGRSEFLCNWYIVVNG